MFLPIAVHLEMTEGTFNKIRNSTGALRGHYVSEGFLKPEKEDVVWQEEKSTVRRHTAKCVSGCGHSTF